MGILVKIEKLSGYICNCARIQTSAGQSSVLPKDGFCHLLNIAIHLLRAIETLDPDRYNSSSSSSSNNKSEPVGGVQFWLCILFIILTAMTLVFVCGYFSTLHNGRPPN